MKCAELITKAEPEGRCAIQDFSGILTPGSIPFGLNRFDIPWPAAGWFINCSGVPDETGCMRQDDGRHHDNLTYGGIYILFLLLPEHNPPSD